RQAPGQIDHHAETRVSVVPVPRQMARRPLETLDAGLRSKMISTLKKWLSFGRKAPRQRGHDLEQSSLRIGTAISSAGTFIFYMFLGGNDPTHYCKFIHDAYEHNYHRNRYVVHNDAPLSFAGMRP